MGLSNSLIAFSVYPILKISWIKTNLSKTSPRTLFKIQTNRISGLLWGQILKIKVDWSLEFISTLRSRVFQNVKGSFWAKLGSCKAIKWAFDFDAQLWKFKILPLWTIAAAAVPLHYNAKSTKSSILFSNSNSKGTKKPLIAKLELKCRRSLAGR